MMHATLSFSPCVFLSVSQNVTTTITSSSSNLRVGLTNFYSATANLSKSSRLVCCWASRRQKIRSYEDEEFEHNEEISILEFYTDQVAKDEALLVNAVLDDQQLKLIVFKGFSSSLSSGTCFDPTRSILPATAVIQRIDRVKAPFDPSNIHYIEKNLHVEAFKTLVHKIKHVRSNPQF